MTLFDLPQVSSKIKTSTNISDTTNVYVNTHTLMFSTTTTTEYEDI
jgi:hypothetical protein